VPSIHDLVADDATEALRSNVKFSRLKRLKRAAASLTGKDDFGAGHSSMAID
jgi:hypothetical protein